MVGEGMTPGICQHVSTVTFSTHFPLSPRLQKKSRGVWDCRVITESTKGQPTKDFTTKALTRVLNCHSERQIRASRKPCCELGHPARGKPPQWHPAGIGCCREHRRSPRYRRAQLRGLVCFPGRLELSLFSFSENSSSRLHRGEPAIWNTACQES